MKNSNAIFGPNIAGVRGKPVRQKSEIVMTDYVAVPREFLELHKYVTLVADVCFVNNVAFLVTISRGIKFVTDEFIMTRTDKQYIKSLKVVMKLYTRGSMKFQTVLMDMEFDKTVKYLMKNVVVNTSSTK